MKSKHDKSSNGSERNSQERASKYDKAEEKYERYYRSRSRSESSRHGDGKKSSHDDKSSKSDKVDHDVLSIYIGNVDYSATDDELRNTFIGCGDIVRVTIIKNMKTGHPKGAAFIEFTDKDGVQAALTLNGKDLKGRPLIVTTKKPRPEHRMREERKSHSSSSRYRSRMKPSMGGSTRPLPRRMPPMPMPPMRMPRYDPYRRPPPEFYDPYMMPRPGPPPMYHHGHSKIPHGRAPLPRYHPYSYRK